MALKSGGKRERERSETDREVIEREREIGGEYRYIFIYYVGECLRV